MVFLSSAILPSDSGFLHTGLMDESVCSSSIRKSCTQRHVKLCSALTYPATTRCQALFPALRLHSEETAIRNKETIKYVSCHVMEKIPQGRGVGSAWVGGSEKVPRRGWCVSRPCCGPKRGPLNDVPTSPPMVHVTVTVSGKRVFADVIELSKDLEKRPSWINRWALNPRQVSLWEEEAHRGGRVRTGQSLAWCSHSQGTPRAASSHRESGERLGTESPSENPQGSSFANNLTADF